MKLYLEGQELAMKEFIYEGYKAKEFQESEKSKFIDAFELNSKQAKESLMIVNNSHLIKDDEMLSVMKSFSQTLGEIRIEFDSLKLLLKERGFRDYGLEGSLRKAIHQVENSDYNYDKIAMLTLRRHEKDFFLRKDLKYQKEFNTTIEDFIRNIQLNGDQREAQSQLLGFIDNYKSEFNRLIDIENEIGLKENEGIRGSLKDYFDNAKPQLEQFRTAIKDRNQSQISRTVLLLIVMALIQIAIGIALAVLYSSILTSSIKEIRTAMQRLAQGNFPDKLQVRSSEEIGQTKIAFNQFIDRIQFATSFAARLGNGETKAVYDEQFTNDVLAKSIVSMQHKLREGEERQAKINWTNQGAAQFNDILKNESEDLVLLGDKILKLLVTFLEANQGALYLLKKDKSEEYLERISTYAYDKKRFVDQRIMIGQGLIGQCAIEKSTIYLKQIPVDYVKITSGLGEATPRNVLIIPLKQREEVMGVLELASFSIFENYQVEFVEKMAENIASILANKQQTDQTKRLLHESEQRAHALVQQEEEMRQNAEELQATQEEMERQKSALQAEIENLKQSMVSKDFALN